MRINIKPLSVNEAWQGRRFKTPAYKAYEKEVMLKLKPMTIPDGELTLAVEFGFSNRASDCSNPLKMIEDILSKYYKFNDNRVYRIILVKTIVPKGEEFLEFEITGENDNG